MWSRVEQWGALRGPYLPSTGASELRDRQLCAAGVGVETRGRGIKVIRHLILRSTWGFLLTSSFPEGLVLTAACSSGGWASFLASVLSFEGVVDRRVQSEWKPIPSDSFSSPNTLFRWQPCYGWAFFLLVMLWLSFTYSKSVTCSAQMTLRWAKFRSCTVKICHICIFTKIHYCGLMFIDL